MTDKKYTSNTEFKRLNIEEPQLTNGQHILPQQIWRDGALIPGSPDDLSFKVPELENNIAVQYSYINDGQTAVPLVEKIEKLPLTKLAGTKNVFHNDLLINLIGREFDNDPTNKKKSWQYILYSDDTELAYDVGTQYIDVAAGNLYFTNKDFIDSLSSDDNFYITFYKYVGRTGFLGASNNEQDIYGGIDIPFRDDIKLLKDADNDNTTANFVLNGDEGNTIYILPRAGEAFIDTDMDIDELGKTTSKNYKKGVVMLQENYQEVDWEIGLHNGGAWLPDGSVRKN